VLFAQALSSLGTSVSTVALAVMVFDLTGSVVHMGGILAASTVPLVLMSLVGGALLDRYEGRRLMVLSDVGRGFLILAIPFAARTSVALVYVVAAAVGSLSALFNPSQVKVMGELADRDEIVRANSYLGLAREGCELGGYLLGGMLVATIGYVATFAIDGASYLVSALLLVGLPRTKVGAAGQRMGALLKETPKVLGSIWSTPALRTNVLFAMLPTMVLLMINPNAYALALDLYRMGPQGFAAMEIVSSIGWIVGGVIASRLNYRGDRNRYVFVSVMLMALCYSAVGLAGSFALSVVFLALAAVANVGQIVGSMALFQELEERPDKGRILAIRGGLGQLGVTAGLLSGGFFGSLLGIPRVFLFIGLTGAVLASLVYLPYGLSLRRGAVASVPLSET